MARLDVKAILARANAATEGPWRSMSDGNQYIDTKYMPTAKLVGAARVDGVRRPWNPHALLAFGFKPEEYETVRFAQEDADFVAAAREDVPALCAEVERLRKALGDFVEYERKRHPPRMGGDEYPPSLRPTMLAALMLLEGE